MRKIYLLLILLIVGTPIALIGVYYISATSALFTISSVGFSDIPDPIEVLLTRKIDVDIYLDVVGQGLVSVPVKSTSGQIYLENIYMGAVKNTEGFMIPSSGTRTIHLVFHLDLSDISLEDLERAVSSVRAHGGEISVKFEGYVEPILLIFPITVPISQTSYILTTSVKPTILSMSWDVSSVEVGETCSFRIRLQNTYRGSTIQGNLKVIVREDVSWGFDKDAQKYDFPIILKPGDEKYISDTFSVYKEPQTRGFFLKAMWGSNILEEQSESYPPRLKVVKGTLEILDTYWIADGTSVSNVEAGRVVEGRIVVRAINGNFHGTVTLRVRKDFVLFPDIDYYYRSIELYLNRGQSKELGITFAPDEATSLSLRGYFIEVDFDEESWTMASDYPPRLKVKKIEEIVSTLQVLDTYWIIDETEVTSAKVDDRVEIWIQVKAIGGKFDGIVIIKIRKDLIVMPDVTYVSREKSISLDEGETIWLRAYFTPDEASSLTIRGYFLEAEYNDESWTMESNYPPRLKVSKTEEEAVTEQGTPVLLEVWWTVGKDRVTRAQVGSNIVAHIKIKAKEGRLDGSVLVRIRKDIPLLPDEDYTVKTFEISVDEGKTVELTVRFSPDKATGLRLRGYFIQIDFTTWDETWTMEDSYPPRLKVS